MAEQTWSDIPMGTPQTEPWETKQPKQKKTGLIVGIAAGVVAIAAAVGVYFALGPFGNPDKLLASAWEKTNKALAEQSEGQPFQAVAAALEDRETGSVELALTDVQVSGETVLDRASLEEVVGKDQLWAAGEAALPDMDPIDVFLLLGEKEAGFGSRALLGSDTLYTIEPGRLAESVKGTIFDPDTGAYPIEREALETLDDLFSDSGELLDMDTAELDAAVEAAGERWTEFVQSVEGEKESGEGPNGEKATALVYTYTDDAMLDVLDDMVNIFLDSGWLKSYFDTLGKMTLATVASADSALPEDPTDELRDAWRDAMQEMRRSYSGDITVTYLLVDGAVAGIEIEGEPTVDGESARLKADIDLGVDDGEMEATVTLSSGADRLTAQLRNASAFRKDEATQDWSLELRYNGETGFAISGESSWDHASGDLSSRLTLEADGEKIALRGEGLLAADDASFDLEYDTLTLDVPGDSLSCGLRAAYNGKADMPDIPNKKALFSLSEAELETLMTDVMTNVSAISGATMAPDAMAYPEDSTGDSAGDYGYGASDIGISDVPGYGSLGMASLNDLDVYVPKNMTCTFSDYEVLNFESDSGLLVNVYAYQDYMDTAEENMAWSTEYWEDMEGLIELSDVLTNGNTAARYCVFDDGYGAQIQVSLLEMRGDDAVFTDLYFSAGALSAEDESLLLELDWALGMPLTLADLIY